MDIEVFMPKAGMDMKEGAIIKQLAQVGDNYKASPYARKFAKEQNIELNKVTPSGVYGEIKARDVEAYIGDVRRQAKVTPLAERMAIDLGIDISQIIGTGYDAKITKSDILAEKKEKEVAVPNIGERREKLTGMRRVVAQRMLQAHAEIPSATITTKVDVTALMNLRTQLKEQCIKKFSVNDMVLKAVAMALVKHKEMLCSFDGDAIIYKQDINIGMAVSVNGGLVVPVIKHADQMSLDQISTVARDLAIRARDNKLNMDEYKGSTFSISNLGMFGVESFTPIINQPDSAILGICGINTELALEHGQVVEKQVMRLSITLDHRLMDGVQAATFNLAVKEYLENPMRLIL